jgi:hypothetical protein
MLARSLTAAVRYGTDVIRTAKMNASAARVLVCLLALAFLTASSLDAAAVSCRPKRARPPVVLKQMAPCEFDVDGLSFVGTPVEQAKCLLRTHDRTRNIGPMLESIPAALQERVGQTSGLPSREVLSTHLSAQGLEWDLAYYLWQPIARARDNDPSAPTARYMVIHDTSGPNYGGRPWPSNIDDHPKINNLRRFWCSDGWAIAHVIINRRGALFLGHDLAEPWRATKFERAPAFGTALKGLFLHVELVQPRRRAPGWGRHNDAQAPTPGFSAAQYDRLALVYTVASVRAGAWLVPAFHAPIDAHIRGGHDDPQNFELDAFAASLDRILVALTPAAATVVKASAD